MGHTLRNPYANSEILLCFPVNSSHFSEEAATLTLALPNMDIAAVPHSQRKETERSIDTKAISFLCIPLVISG